MPCCGWVNSFRVFCCNDIEYRFLVSGLLSDNNTSHSMGRQKDVNGNDVEFCSFGRLLVCSSKTLPWGSSKWIYLIMFA
jgi:hypothetical protein